MPMQAFKATLNILMFRAGPQDFPYSEHPGLTRSCVAVAIVSCAVFFSLWIAPVAAMLAAAIAVGGVSMFTRVLLRVRKLENRYAQTLNTLLAVGATLLLLMYLPMAVVTPVMKPWLDALLAAQEAGLSPDTVPSPTLDPSFPIGYLMFFDLLSLWFIAITAHVLRNAANLGFVSAALIALLCQFNILMLLVFTAPLIALFAT